MHKVVTKRDVAAVGEDAAVAEQLVLLKAAGRWPDDLSIWRLDMPLPRQHSHRVAACYACLDSAERGRADRYRVVDEQTRFIITRATLRHLLGAEVGRPADDLRFGAVANGRPVLTDFPTLSFNVSHTRDRALIAMSRCRAVGVDIEYVDPTIDWQSLVDMVCSGRQRSYLLGASETSGDAYSEIQRTGFFRCWTVKEALLKAVGVGLIDQLSGIDFSLEARGIQRPRVEGFVARADPRLHGLRRLSFHCLTDVDGYAGCIAYSDARPHLAS